LAETDLFFSGGTIIIDHGFGVSTTYLHLSQLNVKVGEIVNQKDKIGEIGATGRATGPHLDWRLNWNTTRLDPALLVKTR
jgi:murein DD-endopeptidase MepM/ murein hydrolase activator NlpD